MTDLDTFRTALHHPDDGRPPALDEIMTAGRRLRRKRGSITATALVLAVAASFTVWQAQAPPDRAVSAWPAAAVSPDGSWGQAVATGLRSGDGDIVVTAFHNVNPAYPDITFGVRSCAVDSSGELGPCKSTFDDVAPDRSPGFHAINLPSNINFVDLPMFGYYVGPADRITVRSRGRVVEARTAVWSEDADIVLFWFTFDDVYLKFDRKPDPNTPLDSENNKVKPGEQPDTSDWAAYDLNGRPLPYGKPFVIG